MKKLLMMADGFVFAGTERSCSNEQKVPFRHPLFAHFFIK